MNMNLMKAASNNNTELVKTLLNDNSIDLTINISRTLIYACEHNNVLMVSLILNSVSQFKREMFDKKELANYNNALRQAIKEDNTQIISILLQNKELFSITFCSLLLHHIKHNKIAHQLLLAYINK